LGQKTTLPRSHGNTRTKLKAKGKIQSKTGVAEKKPEKTNLQRRHNVAKPQPKPFGRESTRMTRILANQKEPNTEISPTNDVTAEERGTGKEETEFTRIQELETNKE